MRNLAFNRLVGDAPESLAGTIVNTMDEYGKSNQKEADKATWKACGQECIDGVFYAFVSRNIYGNESGDRWLRQTAFNSSLIKSTDGGATWTRSARENYKTPMWPGPAFGAPFFIHYGNNGGNVMRDGANRYVYAVSTNGFWNDGDSYVLGRVLRGQLRNLNASDWTYFSGGDGNIDKSWSAKIQDAQPLLNLTTKCGQSGPCYIPALGTYVMVAWYNTEKMAKWYEPNEMRYDFYQAPHPWGPWTALNSFSDRFLATPGHMYGPSLCARFQRQEGTDVHITMFTSGCPFDDVPAGLYKAWAIPVILRTAPVRPSTVVSSLDDRILYKGGWKTSGEGRALGPVRLSQAEGDSAELTFNGTGIEIIADRHAGFGSIDVHVDGAFMRTVPLAIENFPRLCRVTVFRSAALKKGAHTVRVTNKTGEPAALDGFRIYS